MVSEEFFTNESLDFFSEFAKNLRKDIILLKCYGNFIHDEIIDQNANNLSVYLNKTNITTEPQDLSKQTIQHGTELFLYLNICPSSKKSAQEYWLIYYIRLLRIFLHV